MPVAAVDFYLVSAARRAHRLRPGRGYVFGREDGCDVVLQDALASRRHAEVKWAEEPGKPGYWFVVDLNSRNGVLVDNKRITQPTTLTDGAQLQIGGQIFRLHLLPPGGDPASLGNQAPQISSIETMGPGVNLAELATQGATYTGQVTEGGVMELLQFFSATAKTGRLDLLNGAGPAPSSVWVQQGTPVHVLHDNLTGIEALVVLAVHPPQRFAFHAEIDQPPKRSLQGSAQGILMEIARRMDEARRG